jgi:hypothetical protein
MIFGLLAAALLIVAAILRFFIGILFLATGHGLAGIGSFASSIIFVVVGLIIGLFSVIGRSRAEDRSIAIGVILIVLAVLGWLVLGFSSSLLAIIAGVLTLIAGILFLAAGR